MIEVESLKQKVKPRVKREAKYEIGASGCGELAMRLAWRL